MIMRIDLATNHNYYALRITLGVYKLCNCSNFLVSNILLDLMPKNVTKNVKQFVFLKNVLIFNAYYITIAHKVQSPLLQHDFVEHCFIYPRFMICDS